jgi:hypothetical protein
MGNGSYPGGLNPGDTANVTSVSNLTGRRLVRRAADLPHGTWTVPPPTVIPSLDGAQWVSKADPVIAGLTGTESRVTYAVGVNLRGLLDSQEFAIHCDTPAIGGPSSDASGPSDWSIVRTFENNDPAAPGIYVTNWNVNHDLFAANVSLAVSSWSANRLDLFAIGGADGQMLHQSWDGHSWLANWQDLGGQFLSAPSAVSWAADRLDVFGVGADGQMLHQSWDGHSWLANWQRLPSAGGEMISQPSAVSWAPDRLDVFALVFTGDTELGYNPVSHQWWDGRQWNAEWLPFELDNGRVPRPWAGPPTAVSWEPGRLDVFAVGLIGADLNHMGWDGANWSKWQFLGQGLASAPCAAAWAPDRLDVFGITAVAPDTLGVVHQWWNGKAWVNALQNLPGGDVATF